MIIEPFEGVFCVLPPLPRTGKYLRRFLPIMLPLETPQEKAWAVEPSLRPDVNIESSTVSAPPTTMRHPPG